ncbi:MAG: UDP-N-acetylmuramoyl-tripeptide--D-alanyl-D-alanine ligase [Phycisphaeraceae bacterium]|nr:UDP-N-acetylmuramoyl-tripeptide--D-alanyl-D-alanine ligase [Phycisphaerales bacterium]MCB9858951.1 UDP-N-acetylmuramoyl-tripeptide--D-alanyl-D-alanine ligase [Phycisphaeraceae bacterium]
MHTLPLNELASITNGQWITEPTDTAPVTGLTSDSREVTTNLAFAAIRGEKTDGHEYIAKAIASGARLVIVEQDIDPDSIHHTCPILRVDRTIDALGKLATEHRNRLSVPVVAVVGANGKTSTKAAIACAIGSFAHVRSAPKSFNNDLGVPLTLLNTTADHEAVVCEIGTNDPGETAPLAAMVQPNILVITGAGREHLEGLGSVEGSASEIESCLASMQQNSFIITNADEPFTSNLTAPECTTTRIGFHENADARVFIDEQSIDGITMTLRAPVLLGTPVTLHLHTIAAHSARTASMALAASMCVAQRTGRNTREILPGIISAISNRQPEPMRMEVSSHQTGNGALTLINDAYNANPDSMQSAMETLAAIAYGHMRVVLVLGDMRETGTHAQAVHKELADHIVSLRDQARLEIVAFLVGTSVKWTHDRLCQAGIASHLFVEHQSCSDETAAQIAEHAKPNDLVLLKASRSIGLERVAEHLVRQNAPISR